MIKIAAEMHHHIILSKWCRIFTVRVLYPATRRKSIASVMLVSRQYIVEFYSHLAVGNLVARVVDLENELIA